jgi:acyl carrier protein
MNVDQSDDTRERLIEILTAPTQMSLELQVSDMNDDTSLIDDLGLDSIQLLEFSIAIEREFDIQMTKSVSFFPRFGDLVAFVRDARTAIVCQGRSISQMDVL